MADERLVRCLVEAPLCSSGGWAELIVYLPVEQAKVGTIVKVDWEPDLPMKVTTVYSDAPLPLPGEA